MLTFFHPGMQRVDVSIIEFAMSSQNLRLNTQGDQWTTPSWNNTIYENYNEEKSDNDETDDGLGKVSSWWTTSMNLQANKEFLVCFQG